MIILETVVECARRCARASAWREATRRQARACKEERQCQVLARACRRVRSGLTHRVIHAEVGKLNAHAAFHVATSGQLRFPG